MKQNRSSIMLVALVVIVAVGLPYYLSSQKASALDVKTAAIRVEEKSFRDKASAGAKVRAATAQWTKSRETLAAAMPAESDVQGAIRTLQALTVGDAAPDHVKWLQGSTSNLVAARAAEVTPAPTTAKAGSKTPAVTTTVATANIDAPFPSGGFDMTINVSGSRNKVLAFVTKIQAKPEQIGRLFSVKSVSLSIESSPAPVAATSGAATAAAAAGTDGNGLVKASIQLKVTTFGTPPSVTASTVSPAVQPAGPQETTTVVAVPTSAPLPEPTVAPLPELTVATSAAPSA